MKKLMIALLSATGLAGIAHGQIGPDHPLFHAAVHPEPPLPAPVKGTGQLSAKPGETAVHVRYSGYLFGFKIAEANFRAWWDDTNYEVFSQAKTSGLGAFAQKLRIWSSTKGRFDSSGMYPISHFQQNTNKKNRRVNMDYDYNRREVDVVVIPRNGSQGVPPAGATERFTADDVLSGVLNLTMRGHALDKEFCTGSVRIFDSKQHYNLLMHLDESKMIKFDGVTYDGYRCNIYYQPINGFDPEDLPNSEEGGTPLKLDVINRKDIGMYVPVRFTYKISGFNAVIKAKEIEVVSR